MNFDLNHVPFRRFVRDFTSRTRARIPRDVFGKHHASIPSTLTYPLEVKIRPEYRVVASSRRTKGARSRAQDRLQGEIEARIDSKRSFRCYVGGPWAGISTPTRFRTPLGQNHPSGRVFPSCESGEATRRGAATGWKPPEGARMGVRKIAG